MHTSKIMFVIIISWLQSCIMKVMFILIRTLLHSCSRLHYTLCKIFT